MQSHLSLQEREKGIWGTKTHRGEEKDRRGGDVNMETEWSVVTTSQGSQTKTFPMQV